MVRCHVLAVFLSVACAVTIASLAGAQGDYAFIGKIRPDHPRLFFNADTWPAVKDRAMNEYRDHYEKLKAVALKTTEPQDWLRVTNPAPRAGSTLPVHDYGERICAQAFVYRCEPSAELLALIKDEMYASLDFYDSCYRQKQAVAWYSRSRVGFAAAMDWLWDEFTPAELQDIGGRFLNHLHEAYTLPGISYRNGAGTKTGFYGVDNIAFFAGVVFLNEGIDDENALSFLKMGYDTYLAVFNHRAGGAGDDGGGASATLNYLLNEYPIAEWNFFHAYKSATGDDIWNTWPFSYCTLLPNYIIWNWLPDNLEYGYGDTPHKYNAFPVSNLYGHMGHIIHFFGKSHPDMAALAAYIRERAGGSWSASSWGIYPFLVDLSDIPEPSNPQDVLPPARHFNEMGQVFMRSGSGPDDTYALFAGGGVLAQHRQYDANNFIIYKRGFLALDTGTRIGNTDNLQNYFAQTVAHNCMLITMPGEEPASYWNGKVFANDGGQYKTTGSEIIAFETHPEYSYVCGDATPVYRPEKCEQAVRQFVHIQPDYFVVFDRVTATDPTYTKRWLLHHALEPTLNGNTWYSDQDEGRIFCTTLLPENAVIEKIGGPGKEFLAAGANYAIDAGPSQQRIDANYPVGTVAYSDVPELMGRWRVEVKPATERKSDVFLHLIQVGDKSLTAISPAFVDKTNTTAGLTFNANGGLVTITFNAVGEIGGHITISRDGAVVVDRDFSQTVTPQAGIASFDAE